MAADLVLALRKQFQRKYLDKVPANTYDQCDIDRLMTVDKHAHAFIRAKKGDVQAAATMCHSSLTWKKEQGLNHLTDQSFPDELLKKGAMYYRNFDKLDNPIFNFKISLHKKDPKTLPIIEKYMIYLMDREDRKHEGRKVVILFDMSDAGIGNLDLDLIKFLITCFEEYMPDHLAYLLVYDMPWILNAAWKIIKAWLSEDARSKVIFVRGLEINDYIDRDNLSLQMGGRDDYVFEYIPPSEPVQTPLHQNHSMDIRNNSSNVAETSIYGNHSSHVNEMQRNHVTENYVNGHVDSVLTTPVKIEQLQPALTNIGSPTEAASKHVTFSQEDPTVFTSPSLEQSMDESDVSTTPSKANNNYKFRIPAKSSHQLKRDDSMFVDSLITISPGAELSFSVPNGQKEACGLILLTNPRVDLRTAYKVKTTSPEKYKVRPSQGVIKPGQGAEVTVFLAQGHESTVSKDKFLVMAMELEDGFISSGELAEVWKSAVKSTITEHRLRCSYVSPPPSPKDSDLVLAGAARVLSEDKMAQLEKEIANLGRKLDTVLVTNDALERQIRRIGRYQVLLVFLLVVFAIIIITTGYHHLQSIHHFAAKNSSNNQSEPFSWFH